jgi:hypothetical protein
MKKDSKTKDLMKIGLGIAGGLAINELNSFAEKQPFAAKFSKYIPEITAAAAGAALLLMKHKEDSPVKSFLVGAIIVGGAESATGLIHKTIGIMRGEDPSAMGFVPQYIPQKFTDKVVTYNNIPVR